MKKFLALIVCILYFVSSNICYAFSELYYVKNTTENILNNSLKTVLQDKKYIIQKEDPIYAISSKNPSDYIIMMVEPYGNNLLYYYESNENKKLNKTILKNLASSNII